MMLMALFFLLPGVPADGVEFVVRSTCRFERRSNGLVALDEAGTPAGGLALEAVCLHGKTRMTAGEDGRVVLPAGVCVIFHPGSELYPPCVAASFRPRPHGGGGWTRPAAALLALLALALLAYPHVRRFSMPKTGKPQVLPGESAPEPEEVESAPQSRPFLPWRKPEICGQVLVWESGLPLAGVRVSFLRRGERQTVLTDENGEFSIPPDVSALVCGREGYASVELRRPAGRLVIRMMSLPVRALWLLRLVCRRHDPQRAAALSPRDALAARIPPPDVISRLEQLAYAGVLPEPGELETLEAELKKMENGG